MMKILIYLKQTIYLQLEINTDKNMAAPYPGDPGQPLHNNIVFKKGDNL